MRRFLPLPVALGFFAVTLPAVATVRPHRHSSSHAMVSHSAGAAHARHAEHMTSDRAASYGIGSERATAIQTALIKQGYLSGEPSGTWDASSAAAMGKLQSDNGWQTKLVPDSRALIKLGLGPGSDTPEAPLPAAVAPPQF